MSEIQTAKAFAAQEICQLLDRTAAAHERELQRVTEEHRRELHRLTEENRRQRKLLNALTKPVVLLRRLDVQQLALGDRQREQQEEQQQEQQEPSPSPDQEDPPALPHIENQQQEAEQLSEPEELMLTCGGAEPACTFDPDGHLQAEPQVKVSDSPEPEAAADGNYEELLHNVLRTAEEPLVRLVLGSMILNENVPQVRLKRQPMEKRFSCVTCNKRFTQKCTLDTHMSIHRGEKPFTCTVCNKAFRSKPNLSAHMSNHTGDKKYKCPFCPKAFIAQVFLKGHMCVHTGEKDFGCSVCGKLFATAAQVKKHMKIHMREKKKVCSV